MSVCEVGGNGAVVAGDGTNPWEEEPSGGAATGNEPAWYVPGDARWRGSGSLAVMRDLCDLAVVFDTVTPYGYYHMVGILLATLL